MSAVIGALRANLSASVAEFSSDMGKAAASLKGFSKEAQTVAKEIEGAGARMSLALTAPLVLFGKKALDVARESRQALGQVQAALLSTGDASGKTADELQATADKLESISAFDKRDILRQVTSNLLTFTNVQGATFDRAQKAIVDLASRMDGDLAGATIKVGRALQDPIKGTTALTRMGVLFDTQTKATIVSLVRHNQGLQAQGIILDALEKKFAGSAEAMRKADPELVFKDDWKNFEETIGNIEQKILPLFTDQLRSVLKWFQSLEPETQKNIVLVAGLAAVIGPLLVVVAQAIRLVAALATGLRILAVAAAANPWIALLAILALVAGGLYLLATRTTDVQNAVNKQSDAHRTLNKLLDDAKAKGDALSASDAAAAKQKLTLAAATLKAAIAQQLQNIATDKAATGSMAFQAKTGMKSLSGMSVPMETEQLNQLNAALQQNLQDQKNLAAAKTAPPPAAVGGGGGAPPAFDPHNASELAKAAGAAQALGKSLDEMAIKLQHGLDSTNMPKAIADADQLNAQIDEYVKTAQQAGANTGQFAGKIAQLRATIEQLKIAELAKEAKLFTEAVDQDAVSVDKFAKGGLPPLQEKLQAVDDQYRSLRDKITDEIEANRVLAQTNDVAAAAMARLEAQLAKLEDGHKKATAAAITQNAAEKQLADLAAASSNASTAQNIRDLLQSSGGAKAPISTAASDLQTITDDLLQKQNQAAQDQIKLEEELDLARQKGDTDAIARLGTQVQLATQYHTLISNTTAEQIQAAQRMNEAFKTFTDTLTQQLSDSISHWQLDLKSLDDTFGQLAENLFVKPFVQSGVDQLGDALKAIIPGMGGKPDGTATNPLYVTTAPGIGSLTSGSGGGMLGGIGDWLSGLFGGGGGGAMQTTGDLSQLITTLPPIGGFAGGGFIPPGRWGVVGEDGPEKAFGGKSGMTVQSNGGGRPVHQTFNIGRMDQDTFNQTRRQFARTAKGALQ